MPQGEIVTLQLGNYANYVGTHFWNLQDELLGYAEHEEWGNIAAVVDHDVLYSCGEDRHGNAEYYPRLVAVDLSGSLGGLSFNPDATHEVSASSVHTWAGACEVHRAKQLPKSSFLQQLEEQAAAATEGPGADAAAEQQQQQDLEAAARALGHTQDVQYWTDFLKAQLHSGSVLTAPGVWHGKGCLQGFGSAAGEQAMGRQLLEDVGDRLRRCSEACDSLQGFHVLADVQSGFGGWSHGLLQDLADDFPTNSSIYFGLEQQEEQPAPVPLWQSCGTALARALLAPSCSLFVPLACPPRGALPRLRLRNHSAFFSSALLAAAVDTATLPYRLSGASPHVGAPVGSSSLHSWAQLLGGRAANLAALQLALPAPALPGSPQQQQQQQQQAAAGAATEGQVPLHTCPLPSLTPGIVADCKDTLAESLCLRGARVDGRLATCSQAAAVLDAVLVSEQRRTVLHRCVVPMPLAVPLPFPQLFPHGVGRYGDTISSRGGGTGGGAAAADEEVVTSPVLSRAMATPAFEPLLQGSAQLLRRAWGSVAGQHLLQGWGYDGPTVSELQETLRQLAGRYQGDLSD